MKRDIEMDRKAENTVCVIVITYHPDIIGVLRLLGEIDKETDFYVVDNGSPGISENYKQIKNFGRCRSLILLPENVGLARALNIALDKVIDDGYQFALLFDQDSKICDRYVSRIISSYNEVCALADRNIAALGPRIIHPQTQRRMKFKLFNRILNRTDVPFERSKNYFQTDFLITSGSLLSIEALREIGKMREDYFIDNLDLEWCFRAKSQGFELVGTDNVVLYHSIGEDSQNPLVRYGLMIEHSPVRTYYSSRNRIHLYRTSYAPWGWKIRDLVRFMLKSLWLITFSRRRKDYWKNISAGILDAKNLK